MGEATNTTTLAVSDNWQAILDRAARSGGEKVLLRYEDDMGIKAKQIGKISVDHPDDDMRDVYVQTEDNRYTVDGGMDHVFRSGMSVGSNANLTFKDE